MYEFSLLILKQDSIAKLEFVQRLYNINDIKLLIKDSEPIDMCKVSNVFSTTKALATRRGSAEKLYFLAYRFEFDSCKW